MSLLSRTVKRNKNTLSSVFKTAPIVAAPFTGGTTLAVAGAGSGFLSSFFGNKNKGANLTQGLASRSSILSTSRDGSVTDSLLSGIVSYFRSTPTGQKVEAEATKQAVNDKILSVVKTPWVWIAGAVVIVVLFILLRKR